MKVFKHSEVFFNTKTERSKYFTCRMVEYCSGIFRDWVRVCEREEHEVNKMVDGD